MDTFTNDSLTFDVADPNPGGAGPVVFLHGFPQDAQAWDQVAARVAHHGWRTLVPTLRGYGERCSPAGVSAYRMSHLMGDVLALADAAEPSDSRVHLVGHDWGGAVAWNVALHHPHRVASLTVLSTPHPSAFARAARRPRQMRRSWYIGAFQAPWSAQMVSRRLGPALTASGLPFADARRYAERFRAPAALKGPLSWYRSIWFQPAPPPAGVRVRVPTTYIWSTGDMAIDRSAAELTHRYAVGPYRYVELDASHWLPETRAHEVAEHVLHRIGATSAAA